MIGVAAVAAIALTLDVWTLRERGWVGPVADWPDEPRPDPEIAQVVEAYVGGKYGWPTTAYRQWVERREGDTVMVGVVHEDAIAEWRRRPYLLGGHEKAFSVELQDLRVVREWGWQ